LRADLLRRSEEGWLLLFLPILTACCFNAFAPHLQAFSSWQAYYVAASRHMNPYTLGGVAEIKRRIHEITAVSYIKLDQFGCHTKGGKNDIASRKTQFG
jgi:hypothetical protein